jgi:translation elongation factor EF-1beta
MGKTLIVFKIKCIDMEGLDATIEAVKKIQNGEVKDVKKVPIGFGISEIKAAVLIPEKQDHVLSAERAGSSDTLPPTTRASSWSSTTSCSSITSPTRCT